MKMEFSIHFDQMYVVKTVAILYPAINQFLHL